MYRINSITSIVCVFVILTELLITPTFDVLDLVWFYYLLHTRNILYHNINRFMCDLIFVTTDSMKL